MTDEEYIEELKKYKNFDCFVSIGANINAIILVLIKNNLISEEEFDKYYELSKEKFYKEKIKILTKEEKQKLEVGKRMRDLFGKDIS